MDVRLEQMTLYSSDMSTHDPADRFRARRPLRVAAALALWSALAPAWAGAAPAEASASSRALWDKAAALVGENEAMVPGAVYVDVTIRDGDGTLKNRTQTWLGEREGADGRLVTRVLRSVKDGNDNTAQAQEQSDKNQRDDGAAYAFLPMSPENAAGVSVATSGATSVVDGAECVGFDYSLVDQKKQTSRGTVWLDAVTGAPRRMVFSVSPLPPGAKSMTTTVEFAVGAATPWHMTRMETQGEGRLLFLDRRFDVTMQFSDYFRRSTPPQVGTSR